MTEAEAKAKWCPFARVGSGVNGLGAMNRDAMPPEEADLVTRNALCIGSACMAWRAVENDVAFYRDTGEAVPAGAAYTMQHVVHRRVAVGGYCGLAGAPQ
jgi:hypothetical protein